MASTTYIVIDEREKRILTGHYAHLDEFVASLARNPETIEDFNKMYHEIAGELFYTEGNTPTVPEELPIETIRHVLGMREGKFSQQEVEDYWREVSLYKGPNYESFRPDDKTRDDIPELTQELIKEWKQEDPDAEEFPTANDYRKFLCDDGIVVADLRKKELRYISHGAFTIPRDNQENRYSCVKYSLPLEWKIVEE